MRKEINILTSLTAVFAFSMASCGDNIKYVHLEGDRDKVDNVADAYLQTPALNVETQPDENSVTVTIMRESDDKAITIPVNVKLTQAANDGTHPGFSFPETIDFAAGEKESTLTIEYNINQLEEEATYKINVSLPEEYSSTYGLTSMEITIYNPARDWELMGKGTFTDTFWWPTDDSSSDTVEITIWRRNEYYYRINNPYEYKGSGEDYFWFQLLQEGEQFEVDTYYYDGSVVPIAYDITMPNLVGWPSRTLLFEYWGVTYFCFMPQLAYFYDDFNNFANIINWSGNRVVAYQENGLPKRITLQPLYQTPLYDDVYYPGDDYGYPTEPPVTIVFPDL